MVVANNNAIPPAGLPAGSFSQRRPTLLPNFDKPVATTGIGGGYQSPADFLAANPRVDATATATIGGSVTTGDDITVDLTNAVLGNQGISPPKLSVTYVTIGGDTLATIAENLATLINDSAVAQQADIRADAVGAVMTVRQSGPIGNLSVLTSPTADNTIITLGGTALTGDQVNVLFTGPGLGGGVLIQTAPTTGQTATQMGDALVTAIGANSTLSGLSITAANTTGAVKLTFPAGDYQVQSWVNAAAPTVTVAGTPDTADTLALTFTAANLPGGSRVISYTTLVTDTTTALAAQGLVNAINADPVLSTAGITATRSGSIISIVVAPGFGQVRYSQSASGTLTLTLSAAPTTTAVKSTAQTETVTFSNSGKLSGGSGPIICTNNFDWAYNGQAQSYFYGTPYAVDYQLLLALVNGGAPIV